MKLSKDIPIRYRHLWVITNYGIVQGIGMTRKDALRSYELLGGEDHDLKYHDIRKVTLMDGWVGKKEWR